MTNDKNSLIKISEAVFARYSKVGFSHLSKPEQVFVCVWSLEAEVNNGGFDQFYFNSSGDHAVETVDALESIGASHTAEIVRRANAVFGASGPSSVRAIRQEQLDALPESVRGSFDTLDQEFYAYKDDLEALLRAYVVANTKALRVP